MGELGEEDLPGTALAVAVEEELALRFVVNDPVAFVGSRLPHDERRLPELPRTEVAEGITVKRDLVLAIA
jgi:hypothetical protein